MMMMLLMMVMMVVMMMVLDRGSQTAGSIEGLGPEF